MLDHNGDGAKPKRNGSPYQARPPPLPNRVLELTFRSDFPRPADELGAGDVWLLGDVEAWLNQHDDVLAEVFKGE